MNKRVQAWLVAGAAAIVYANTLANGFVYDDRFYVVGNAAVTGYSLAQILRPMTNGVFHLFRPVTIASLAANWEIGGPRPFGFHLVNILLHAAVALLLYFVLRKLLEELPQGANIAFAAALLFAVHPIHTEAVAWITGRSELLTTGFLLAAWLLHLQDRPVGAMVCFALALFSKESGVVFLPLIAAGDYARGKFKPLSRYAWICGVTALYVALVWKVQGGRFDKGPYSWLDNPLANLPAVWRILNALRVAWKYVGLQLYPAKLSCDYSYNAIHLYADWKHTLPVVAATLLVVGAWIWTAWTKRNAWMLAGAMYFAGFAVTSNILVSTGTIMGERLAYLPSAGICLLLALTWGRLESWNTRVAFSVLGLLALLLGGRSMVRNRDWKSNLTLYSAAVRVVPGSSRAHGLLGQEYLRLGKLEAARDELATAIAVFPNYALGMENYALVEARLGHDKEAREFLERAWQLTPRTDPDYNSNGITFAAWLLQHGDEEAALGILNPIIAASPGESRAWSNRAVIRYQRGELGPAREDVLMALQLDPGNAQAQSLLAALDNKN